MSLTKTSKRVVLLLMLGIFLLRTALGQPFAGGTGEPNAPFLIANSEHLNVLHSQPDLWDKHFTLINSIDMSGIVFSEAVITTVTKLENL